MNANQEVIGVKTETTQNTAATLAATDYFLAWDVSDPSPVIEVLPRDQQSMTLDQLASARGDVMVEIGFKTEMIGGGAAGTAYAPVGAMLLAMGASETVSASTSVTYAPVSVPASASFFTLGKSATVEVYKGATTTQSGLKHQIKGAVVTSLSLKLTASKLPYWEVKMQGLYVTVSDSVAPSVTYPSTVAAKVESISFSTHSYSAVCTEIDIDFGIENYKRSDVSSADGLKGFEVTNRKPKASITVEAVSVATHDYYGKMKSGVAAAMSFAVGATAGNIHTWSFTKTQYNKITQVNDNGKLKLKIDIQINKTSGDDWFSYIQT